MKKYLFLSLVLTFFGCSPKQPSAPTQTKSLNLLISSPKTKLNETGFLHKSGNDINFQLYSSGNSIASITFGRNICFKDVGCKDELKFQNEFLGKIYSRRLFTNILEAKPIYNGQNIVKKGSCFSQDIEDISYEVCDNQAKFVDKKANVKIIARNLD